MSAFKITIDGQEGGGCAGPDGLAGRARKSASTSRPFVTWKSAGR